MFVSTLGTKVDQNLMIEALYAFLQGSECKYAGCVDKGASYVIVGLHILTMIQYWTGSQCRDFKNDNERK